MQLVTPKIRQRQQHRFRRSPGGYYGLKVASAKHQLGVAYAYFVLDHPRPEDDVHQFAMQETVMAARIRQAIPARDDSDDTPSLAAWAAVDWIVSHRTAAKNRAVKSSETAASRFRIVLAGCPGRPAIALALPLSIFRSPTAPRKPPRLGCRARPPWPLAGSMAILTIEPTSDPADRMPP